MHACAGTNRTNHILVSTCVQHRMKDTQRCLLQSRIYRALHNSVERDCQHDEFQCECFRPLHTLLGLYTVYRDTNSLTPLTPRRLQRNLQQRQRTLYKKKCRCTSYNSPRTLKSGVHLFAALENSLNRRLAVFQCRLLTLPRQRVSPCLSLRFCLALFDRFCLKENSSLSSEFLCMTVGCRGDSAIALGHEIWLRVSPGCQMHLD